ncbi:MAG: phosphohydrolase [Candidatus Competibacteraceae bacterium]|nr:phosphohydrolase [Candidatus Competibacteraceae bacterium]
MQTASGRKFWPLDPKPEDVDIEDIAHALANICRFGGHTTEFYSVAQHSLHTRAIVQRVLGGLHPKEEFAALLHDASEAYLGDVIRPLKVHWEFTFYRRIEARVQAVINERFGLPADAHRSEMVRYADEVALATEKRDLLRESEGARWQTQAAPDPDSVHAMPWSQPTAKAWFLKTFRELGGV